MAKQADPVSSAGSRVYCRMPYNARCTTDCKAARSVTITEATRRGWHQGRKAGRSPVSASSRHASRACCAAKTTCFSKPGSCSGVLVSLTAFTSAKALALRAASLQANPSLLKPCQLAFRPLHHHLMSQLHFRMLHMAPCHQRRFPVSKNTCTLPQTPACRRGAKTELACS